MKVNRVIVHCSYICPAIEDKHHHKELGVQGVIMKQHTTLIPKDSYAKGHGYNSLRFAERITYNINTGTVSHESVM